MKYSRKQLEKGICKWISESRLTPSEFESVSESREVDVDELAKRTVSAIIDYINQDK